MATRRIIRRVPLPQKLPFDIIPTDVQCEIFSYPMTLQEFLSLRETSSQVKKNVEKCITDLQSKGDEGSLFPDLIMDLKRIKRIAPEYPIIISTEEDIITLAKHPTLQEATFDVSIATEQDRTLIYGLITLFFEKYIKLDVSCESCNSNPRYTFNFFYYTDEYHLISISEGSIILIKPPLHKQEEEETDDEDTTDEDEEGGVDPDWKMLKDFYIKLGSIVPICEYRGPYDEVSETINYLPCLKRVYFSYQYGYYDESGWSINLLRNPNITEYYMSIPVINYIAGDYYDTQMDLDIFGWHHRGDVFPHVTTFFPVRFNYVDRVISVFPGLTSVSISLLSLEQSFDGRLYLPENLLDVFASLDSIEKIILVIDFEGLTDKQPYIDFFPENLRHKITFQSSE